MQGHTYEGRRAPALVATMTGSYRHQVWLSANISRLGARDALGQLLLAVLGYAFPVFFVPLAVGNVFGRFTLSSFLPGKRGYRRLTRTRVAYSAGAGRMN